MNLRHVLFGSAAVALALSCGAAANVHADAPAKAAAPQTTAAPQGQATLVFALTTGMEDQLKGTIAFNQAKMAAEQHKLKEVVVLVYGRGVYTLDSAIKVRPPALVDLQNQALAAGVRILVCANSLEKLGIPREKVEPAGVEIIPNAAIALVDYATRGTTVVTY